MAKTVWPPTSERRQLDKYAEWAAWLSGDPAELLDIYSANFSLNQGNYNFIDNDIGYNTLNVQEGLFWGKDIQGERETMLHIPVAGDIAQTSADLLFSETPDFKIPEAHEENADSDAIDEQDRLDTIIEETDVYSRLLEMAETGAALGGAYLKVNWDTDFKPYPILSVAQPDNAIPEFKWGFLQRVTFFKTIARKDSNVRYRLLEIHEKGRILNQLYKGYRNDLGQRISLDSMEQTAGMEDEILTGIDDLTCRYIPNKKPNRLWRGSDLGQSDYSGIEGIMDGIDEAWTSWLRDLRLARARIVVPDYMLQKDNNNGFYFDIDQDVFTQVNMGPASSDETPSIEPIQFDIRAEKHRMTIENLMKQAYSLAGFSPSTFGMDDSGGAITAKEVKAREGKTFKTRGKKAKYIKSALEEMLYIMLKIDAEKFGTANGKYKPQVDLKDSIQTDPLEKAESLQKLEQASAISIDTKVRELHPNWTEEQIEAEVNRIMEEKGMSVNSPTEMV